MSRLIDAAVEKRDEERYERLQQLEERESEAWSKMREEVLRELDEEDPRLKNASPKDMLDEISSRGNAAIMITFDARFIDENFKAGTEVTVRFSDELTEEDMRTAVIGLGLQYTLERARRNGMEGIQRLLEG